jgi:hypothetical protein
MRVLRRRLVAGLLAVGLVGFQAGVSWADCATYISGKGDNADSGWLVGTEEVRETVQLEGSISYYGSVGGTYSRTTIYTVGYYEMESGSTIKVDCRTYTQI